MHDIVTISTDDRDGRRIKCRGLLYTFCLDLSDKFLEIFTVTGTLSGITGTVDTRLSTQQRYRNPAVISDNQILLAQLFIDGSGLDQSILGKTFAIFDNLERLEYFAERSDFALAHLPELFYLAFIGACQH